MLAPTEIVEWCTLALREALTGRPPMLLPTSALASGELAEVEVPPAWLQVLEEPTLQVGFVRKIDGETTRLLLGDDVVLMCIDGSAHCLVCEVDPELSIIAGFEVADFWGDETETTHHVVLTSGEAAAYAPNTGNSAAILEWVIDRLEELLSDGSG